MTLATDLKKIKNHIAITKCEEVAAIMLPMLTKHGVTVFNYYRIYFDGSVIRLSTDKAWAEHFFKKNYLNKLTVPQSYLTNPVNYYIWLTEDCPEMLQDAALNFNISNGISIAKRYEDHIEYFCFATTVDNKAIINNFYLNHLDALQNYCVYFKEQAHPLLKTGEKSRILTSLSTHYMKESHFLPYDQNALVILKLSERQIDCARLLLEGISYKEMGKRLDLSPRTIETHLNHIKNKLNCRNRTELIIKLTEIFKF